MYANKEGRMVPDEQPCKITPVQEKVATEMYLWTRVCPSALQEQKGVFYVGV